MAKVGHPSGPTLPGHAACGPGRIWDHQVMRCISLAAYQKKYGGPKMAGKKKSGPKYG
jgi:hypothetical protein